jgi:hypothetical protein
MYMGCVSVTGSMNMGVLAAWRLLLRLLPWARLFPTPGAGAATGWKSEKMALRWGWHGVFALEEATLWFWREMLIEIVMWEEARVYLADEIEGNRVSGLRGDAVGRELEFVVRCYCYCHGGSGCGEAVGESRVGEGAE